MNTPTPIPTPQDPLQYPGFNAVLMGPPGTGKTAALATLALAGLETFVVFLEPGLESLVGRCVDPKPQGFGLTAPPPNLHWHYLEAKQRGFGELEEMAQKIGKFDLKFLANYKDTKRAEFNRFESLYNLLNNFVDQRTGQEFGSVDTWTNERVLCIDGTTGLTDAALEMMTGDKPVRDKPDYGVAQHAVMTLIRKLTQGCNCHVVLIAHVERMTDDVLGGIKLMPITPGKAISGTISTPFSDVILAKREGTNWYWDTADSTADLKTRNLSYQSKLPPDFAPLLAKWKARRDAAVKG